MSSLPVWYQLLAVCKSAICLINLFTRSPKCPVTLPGVCALNLGPPQGTPEKSSCLQDPPKSLKMPPKVENIALKSQKRHQSALKWHQNRVKMEAFSRSLDFMKIGAPLTRNHGFSGQGWVPGRPKIKKKPQSPIFNPWIPKSSVLNPILDQKVPKRCPTE